MRVGWRWGAGLLLVIGGCSLDEIGLAPFGPGGGMDSSVLDSGGDDSSLNDATTDAVTANDAPDDSTITDAGVVDTGALDTGVDAGPVITITGGTYTLDGVDAGVCSGNNGSSIIFQLQNQRDASVDLIWVNFQCGEQVYATVAPSGSANQQTYVNHVWRVRNSSNQAFLAEFILTQQATYTVTMH